jgi:TolA-binding protein
MPPKKKLTPEQLAAMEQEKRDLELADHCMALKQAQEREQAQFNELQLQRDKLNHFWIIAKKQLEDKKSELRNKEREIQVSRRGQANSSVRRTCAAGPGGAPPAGDYNTEAARQAPPVRAPD